LNAAFAGACDDLFEARLSLARKDTRAHRAAVAACLARIDVVLDVFLDVGRHWPSEDGAVGVGGPGPHGPTDSALPGSSDGLGGPDRVAALEEPVV
jgi:hypothetical protein